MRTCWVHKDYCWDNRKRVEKYMKTMGYQVDPFVEVIPAADVRALEEALQKIIRWCQPSLSKTEPTKITGAFFAGTVTPTAEAVLARNVINIAKQALGPGEDQ
jgi:hypothetical protein